jgi:hypothetical protein
MTSKSNPIQKISSFSYPQAALKSDISQHRRKRSCRNTDTTQYTNLMTHLIQSCHDESEEEESEELKEAPSCVVEGIFGKDHFQTIDCCKQSIDELSICNERSDRKHNVVKPSYTKPPTHFRSKSQTISGFEFIKKFRKASKAGIHQIEEDYRKLRQKKFSIASKIKHSKEQLEFHNKH